MRTIGVRDHVRGKCRAFTFTAAFTFTRHAPGSSAILKMTLSTGDIPSSARFPPLEARRCQVFLLFSMDSVILTQVWISNLL